MPIYEYQCEACGHRLEKIQKIADDPLKDCPQCSKPELRKLVSAAAFRLKGSGWYETDFKTGSKKNVLHGTDPGSKSGSDSGKSSDSSSSSSSSSSSTGASSSSAGAGNSSGKSGD